MGTELDVGQKTMLGSQGGNLRPIREPRFGKNRGNVPSYSCAADLQFVRNDGVCPAHCDQPQYLELSRAETRKDGSVQWILVSALVHTSFHVAGLIEIEPLSRRKNRNLTPKEKA